MGGGNLVVRCHHLASGVNLLPVAGAVGGDLRGFRPLESGSLKIVANLLRAGAGGIKVLLGVALDFGRATASGLNLVAEIAEAEGEFGLVDGSGKLLGVEQAACLEGAGTGPAVAFGHVEDDGMGVELRRGVAVYGPGCVVLELGCGELAGGLGGVVPADPRLRVAFQF